MSVTIFSRARNASRSLLDACKRFEEFESTSNCAAMPRIPHHR